MKSVVEIYPLDEPDTVVRTYRDCSVECGLKAFFSGIWDSKTESRPAIFSRELLTVVSDDGIFGARYKIVEKETKLKKKQELRPALA